LYFHRREKLGQTIATSINYLKNLNTLVTGAINTYSLEDSTFPTSFDGGPSLQIMNSMKLLHQKLKLLYARKLKLQPSELFKRKTAEAVNVPDYSEVHGVMQELMNTLPNFFDQMEEYYGAEGSIKLLTDKTSSPLQKHVSIFGPYQTRQLI